MADSITEPGFKGIMAAAQGSILMLCQHCGTDTPHPAIACQSCRTPFPPASVPNTDSETMTYGTGTPPPRPVKGTGPLAIGAPFGARYRILRELGAGGMGVVYQAWDAELGVAVALKVVRPEVTNDPAVAPEVERRFKRELLLARQVTHKNVVRIHDLGEIDGIKYITMPYIEGRDLAGVLRERGQLPAPEALRIGKQIAAGLLAAHDAGVVHRDLKPENIMIDANGQALIMDFGISRSVTTGTATVTGAGAIMGTLEYMAPEQASGVAVDHRADIYSFGLILHDMLAGRRRVASGSSALSEMMARMQQQPPPLRTIAPEVPEPLERIVTKCLQPKPEQRYETTRALVDDLGALDPDGHSARRPLSRDYQWKTATAAMLVLMLLAAGTAVWLAQRGPGTTAPAVARETVSVLIADFENETKDPVFEGSLEQSLAIALEGSPFITVYPQKSARTLAAELSPGSGGRITQQLGQLISRSAGVKVLVTGTISQSGNSFRLAIRATDAATNRELAREDREVASKGEVLQAVASLSERLRTDLGESSSDMAKLAAAETFTTASIDAMRAYARAQEAAQTGNYQEALKLLQDAVSHDPKLGRAYAAMGAIYVNLKQIDRAEASFKQAMNNLDRMSEREKYRTLATYYIGVVGNYEKAIDNYEKLIESFPADNNAYGNLAFAYVRVGDIPRAKEVAKRGLDIYPDNLLQRTNYAGYAVYAGDFQSAQRDAEQVLAKNAKYEFAYLPLALARMGQGDVQGARDAYARLAQVSETGQSLAALGIADIDVYSGRLAEAATRLRESLALDIKLGSTGELAAKRVVLGEIGIAGNDRAALDELRAAIGGTSLLNVIVPAARAAIEAGADGVARAVVKDLQGRLQNQTAAYAAVLEAELALEARDYGRAIDLLKDALKRQDLWLARFVLGRAYFEAGAGHEAEALDEWERCLARRGEAMDVFFADSPTTRYLPPLFYWLGRARENAGSPKTAAAAYREYLNIRGTAPRDPLAADAQRRLTALQ